MRGSLESGAGPGLEPPCFDVPRGHHPPRIAVDDVPEDGKLSPVAPHVRGVNVFGWEATLDHVARVFKGTAVVMVFFVVIYFASVCSCRATRVPVGYRGAVRLPVYRDHAMPPGAQYVDLSANSRLPDD